MRLGLGPGRHPHPGRGLNGGHSALRTGSLAARMRMAADVRGPTLGPPSRDPVSPGGVGGKRAGPGREREWKRMDLGRHLLFDQLLATVSIMFAPPELMLRAGDRLHMILLVPARADRGPGLPTIDGSPSRPIVPKAVERLFEVESEST